jgi:hypothetical protein
MARPLPTPSRPRSTVTAPRSGGTSSPQQSLFYSTVYSSPEVDCPSTNRQRANDLSPYYKF